VSPSAGATTAISPSGWGRLPIPEGKPVVVAYEHGTLGVEMFAPVA
jgi:hypothetical protein